jgi:hypothetical protein
VWYGDYFENGRGGFVELDRKLYVQWLEKAANQNNPLAMDWLGTWFEEEGENEKKLSYYFAAAELGWKHSMEALAEILRDGEGCAKDSRQAVIWSAKGRGSFVFWSLLGDARRALEIRATEELDYDFNQLCYDDGLGIILVSV